MFSLSRSYFFSLILFSLLLIAALITSAQAGRFVSEYPQPPERVVNISIDNYLGSAFKHSPKFATEVRGPEYAFEISASKPSYGEKDWQRGLNYPEIGGSFLFTRFNNRDEFGNAYSLMPHVSFYVRRRSFVDLYLRLGFGVSWISKPYNRFSNTENNIIGTNINNIAQLKFGMNWKLHPNWSLRTGVSLTHFSNGSFARPNLGINTIHASLGLSYHLSKEKTAAVYDSSALSKPKERSSVMLKFGMAINERHTTGGPKYPVYITTMQYSYFTSRVNQLNFGFIYSLDVGTWEELIDRQIDEDKSQKASATELSFYVGDEILLGKVGIYGLVGVYLLRPEFVPSRVFSKWGVNYYFWHLPSRENLRTFLGVNIKAHNFVAQYLEFSAGVTF